jgi:hypothetical protein
MPTPAPRTLRPQSRPLRQTLLLGLLVLGIMIVGVLWLQGYDKYVNALQISGQVAQGRGAGSGQQVDSALNDSLLIFGFLATRRIAANVAKAAGVGARATMTP